MDIYKNLNIGTGSFAIFCYFCIFFFGGMATGGIDGLSPLYFGTALVFNIPNILLFLYYFHMNKTNKKSIPNADNKKYFFYASAFQCALPVAFLLFFELLELYAMIDQLKYKL